MSKSIILSNIKKLSSAVVAQQKNVAMLEKGVSVPVAYMSTREECSFLDFSLVVH